MKKILQYGLYVLMASAFVDVNAVKPSLSSTSSDQLTSEQRAAKMSAPTVDVAKAQDFIEDHEVEMVGLKAAGDAVDLSKTSIKNFYCGKVKSDEEVRSLQARLPESVETLYLSIEDDVALESQFEIFETTLERFPHITGLMLSRWQVKLSPAIIDCASSHQSLTRLYFYDKDISSGIFLDPSNEEMLKEMREKLI